MKISLLLFTILFPVLFWSQDDEPPESTRPDHSNPFEGRVETMVVEDFYNEDGTFYQLGNEKVIAKGTHINKILDGKYTEYDLRGNITRKCTYRMGKLDGEEIRFEPINTTYTKQYDCGVQIGYEVMDAPSQNSYVKTGPYFAGSKSEPFVYTRTKSLPLFDKEGTILLHVDSILFIPNKPVEVHRWLFTKTNDYIRDTITHTVTILLNEAAAAYSMSDVVDIQRNEFNMRYDYDPLTAYKDREVHEYYKNGKLKGENFENYRLTYYPNGTIQDSILPDQNQLPYYHYRNDSLGVPLFRSKFEFLREEKIKRLTFDYLKNNQTFYTITSVNYVPEKVTSSNDSIKQCIQKGEVVDYYGTHYMTKTDGTIDTSYSKQVFPFRCQTPLKEGKYYFLQSRGNNRVLVLQVEKVRVFTYEMPFDKAIWNRDTVRMKHVMQFGNRYYLSKSMTPSSKSKKLLVENGRIYAVDWETSQLLVDDRRFEYSIEMMPEQIQTDTLLSFKTALLTEQEFQKALKMKSISKMPKTEFNEMLEEIKIIRLKEKDALSHFSYDDRSKVEIESRAVSYIFYSHGYKPYFSEEEFSQLMTSYGWTKEEEWAIKNVLRR